MAEKKSIKVEVEFDEESIEILRKVQGLHKISVINMGLKLIKHTNYYKTITGENKSEVLEDILSLDDIVSQSNETSTSKTTKTTPIVEKAKPTTVDWG